MAAKGARRVESERQGQSLHRGPRPKVPIGSYWQTCYGGRMLEGRLFLESPGDRGFKQPSALQSYGAQTWLGPVLAVNSTFSEVAIKIEDRWWGEGWVTIWERDPDHKYDRDDPYAGNGTMYALQRRRGGGCCPLCGRGGEGKGPPLGADQLWQKGRAGKGDAAMLALGKGGDTSSDGSDSGGAADGGRAGPPSTTGFPQASHEPGLASTGIPRAWLPQLYRQWEEAQWAQWAAQRALAECQAGRLPDLSRYGMRHVGAAIADCLHHCERCVNAFAATCRLAHTWYYRNYDEVN